MVASGFLHHFWGVAKVAKVPWCSGWLPGSCYVVVRVFWMIARGLLLCSG